MQNRTFLFTLFLSALLTLGFIVLLPMIPGAKTDPASAWAHGLYKQKLARLHQLRGNRIYVVSGSSSLFSLDTQVLSQAIGRPVLNLATHAGLGLSYILDRAEREMQPGDTIIFTPEYSLLEQSAAPNQLTIDFVTFFDRPYIATRPLAEQTHFYLGYGFMDSIVETLKTIRTGVQVGRPDLTIDDLGNARGNTVALSVKDTVEFSSKSEPVPISRDALAALQNWSALAHEKHARILTFPSALIHLPNWNTPGQRALRQQARSIFQQLGMIPRGDDSTGWIEPDGIYDSALHANDAGRAIYTRRIAVLLCREIRCARSRK
jgi:hypothetical protein